MASLPSMHPPHRSATTHACDTSKSGPTFADRAIESTPHASAWAPPEVFVDRASATHTVALWRCTMAQHLGGRATSAPHRPRKRCGVGTNSIGKLSRNIPASDRSLESLAQSKEAVGMLLTCEKYRAHDGCGIDRNDIAWQHPPCRKRDWPNTFGPLKLQTLLLKSVTLSLSRPGSCCAPKRAGAPRRGL